jgi:hypothetical protein
VEKRKKENEMRLIDADALIEFCAERWIPLNIDAVNMQPTIQPEKTQLSQSTTSDLISRQAAIDAIHNLYAIHGSEGSWIDQKDAFKALNSLPPAKPEPKKGEWSDGYRWQRCSLCKQTGKKSWNYCPNCGAKMTISTK